MMPCALVPATLPPLLVWQDEHEAAIVRAERAALSLRILALRPHAVPEARLVDLTVQLLRLENRGRL